MFDRFFLDDAGSIFSLKRGEKKKKKAVPLEEGLPAFPCEICYSNAAAVRAATRVMWQGSTRGTGEAEGAVGLTQALGAASHFHGVLPGDGSSESPCRG